VIKEDMFLGLFLLVTTTIVVVVPVESYHVECDPTCHEDIEFASISILNGTTMMKYQAQPVRKIRTHTLTHNTHTHTTDGVWSNKSRYDERFCYCGAI